MRLVSLELSGFRAFAETQVFDLDADSVIVVGANGHGKTSLFDGILWAITGRVDRLDASPDIVLSKYASVGEARAVLTLRSAGNGQSYTIRRTCDGKTSHVVLETSGNTHEGPSAQGKLFELLWPEAATVPDGNAALSSVMTRSVYLQQDLVREFIDATDDEQCFTLVSELVGAGRVAELKSQLEKAKTAWTRATNTLQEELRPIRQKVALLESQLAEINQRLERSEASGVATSWEAWEAEVVQLLAPGSAPSGQSSEPGVAIDSLMAALDGQRRALDRRLALLRGLADEVRRIPALPVGDTRVLEATGESLKRDIAGLQAQIQSEQVRVAELRRTQAALKERTEQLRTLATIAENLLDGPCPVCNQQHDRDKTRQHLRELQRGLVQSAEAAPTEALPGLLAALSQKEAEVAKNDAALRNVRQQASQVEAARLSVKKRSEELALSASTDTEMLAVIEAATKAASETRGKTESLYDRGEEVALQLTQAANLAKKTELEKEIVLLKGTVEKRDAALKERSHTGELGQQIVEAMREATSAVVATRLEQLTPLLQSIYSRIDPHPAFRAVSFLSEMVRGRGCLYTVLKDPVTGVDSDSPKTVLSSSQMNALAVSVFLALNLGMPQVPVSALILDDPLQSLDDINLLGLIDLLRRAKDQRQLCLSTHDSRFGKLLAHKLRPGDHTQRSIVIELVGWDRAGPEVQTTELRADPATLRLVAS